MRALLLRYAALAATVLVLNFLLPRWLPGDPLDQIGGDSGLTGPALSETSRAQLRSFYHLDRPVHEQFGAYLGDLASGDLGWSIARARPVGELIVERAPWTIGLVGGSILIACAAGVLWGLAAAWRSGRLSSLSLATGTALAAFPEFLVAILLLTFLSASAGWFPLFGGRSPFGASADLADVTWHLALPLLTLVLVSTAAFALLTTDVLRAMLRSPFLDTARAKGLGDRTVALRHALPNAFAPLVAFLGIRLGHVLGGALVVERVFAVPGLGLLAFEAIRARDYPVLQTLFLLGSLGVLTINLLVDIWLLRLPGRPAAAGVPEQSAHRFTAQVGIGILALFTVAGAAAPLLAPYDPRLASGPPLSQPDGVHWLGTNDLGQDLLSIWLFGARNSLAIAALVAVLTSVLAWSAGLLTGFGRGSAWPVATLADAVMALPALPLYMLVIAFVRPSQAALVLVLALLAWPASARIVRAHVLATRSASHVEAAFALGATRSRIVLRHVLPATLSLLPMTLMLNVRYAIFAEATLAFLGLGDPSNPSWGTSLAWAFADPLLLARPTWLWWTLPPALSIVIVVVAVTSTARLGLGTAVRRGRRHADDTGTSALPAEQLTTATRHLGELADPKAYVSARVPQSKI